MNLTQYPNNELRCILSRRFVVLLIQLSF